MNKHPIQPIVEKSGVQRFQENAIVRHLLNFGQSHGCGLNELAGMPFDQDDREQFAQLIGYSLSGYSELSYVRNETVEAADVMAASGCSDSDAKYASMVATIHDAREAAKQLATALFNIHPDDLHP